MNFLHEKIRKKYEKNGNRLYSKVWIEMNKKKKETENMNKQKQSTTHNAQQNKRNILNNERHRWNMICYLNTLLFDLFPVINAETTSFQFIVLSHKRFASLFSVFFVFV